MKEIQSIAIKHNTDPNLLLVLVKLVTKKYHKRNSINESSFKYSHGSYEDVAESMSHREKYENTPWMESVQNALTELIELYPKEYNLDVDNLIDMCCIINTNIYGMEDGEQAVGIGMYVHLLLINHSCSPNTTFSVLPNSPKMYCRAMRDIKKGEEITLSYIDLYQPRLNRQKELLETKHFFCQCERCSEPMDESIDALVEGWFCTDTECRSTLVCTTVKTTTKKSKRVQEKKVWKCMSCSKEVRDNIIQEHIENIADSLESADAYYRMGMVDRTKSILNQILEEYADPKKPYRMVPENHLLFNARLKLMNCCTRTKDIIGGLINCQYVIKCFEKIHPYDFEISNYYCHLGDILVNGLNDPKSSSIVKSQQKLLISSLEKAYDIRRKYLGETHPLTNEAKNMIKSIS